MHANNSQDKLSITSTNKSFAIYLADLFTHGWAEQYSQLAEGPLAIVVDTARGQVRVVTDADRNGTLLMESDSLKYETLSKIPFDFKITAKGDGSYTLRILDTEGTITPAMLEAAPKLTKLNEVYLTVCPYDSSGATSMSYNLLALHGGDVVCADEMTDAMQASIDGVIAAIKRVYNEKGQIVPASGALLDAAFRDLREEGAACIFLEVRTQNAPARALYTSLGFTQTGVRKGFYKNPADDAVLMKKPL